MALRIKGVKLDVKPMLWSEFAQNMGTWIRMPETIDVLQRFAQPISGWVSSLISTP
jgi:hypothetical protein